MPAKKQYFVTKFSRNQINQWRFVMEIVGFSEEEFKEVKDLLDPEGWCDEVDNKVISRIVNISGHCINRFDRRRLLAVIVFYQDSVSKKRFFRLIDKHTESGGSDNCSFALKHPSKMSKTDIHRFDYYANIHWGVSTDALYELIKENNK